MNTYALEVRAVCPVVDGERDLYQVEITSMCIIEVERINAFFAQYSEQKIFQEKLTLIAAMHFGTRVKTVGVHSGVTVTCVAP